MGLSTRASELVDRVYTSDSMSRATVHPLLRPWWIGPLVIYVVMRAVNVAMMLLASKSAVPVGSLVSSDASYHVYRGGTAAEGYFTTVTNWDGQWYWDIAANGYPGTLPLDASGHVEQNAWAFFPLYPLSVRAAMLLTGVGFPVAASVLSFVFGATAMLLVYRLVATKSDRLGALLAVLCLSSFTCAPVFLMAYAEGLALVLVGAVLLAFHRHRYGLTALFVALLALTRGVVLPLAAVFALCALISWRRNGWRFSEMLPPILLVVWSTGLALLWPAVAGLVTGRSDAYVLTQAAWNPDVTSLPVLRFLDRASELLGSAVPSILIAVALIVALISLLTLGQRDVVLGLWSGAYGLYLLAVVDWNTTALRYFLLAIPVLWPLTDPGRWSDRRRLTLGGIILVLGVMSQWWWIRHSLTISPQLHQLP